MESGTRFNPASATSRSIGVHDRSKRPFRHLLTIVTLLSTAGSPSIASQPGTRHPPPSIRPISPELGLFDVAVEDPDGTARWVELLDESGEVVLRVPLAPLALSTEPSALSGARILLQGSVDPQAWPHLTLRIDSDTSIQLSLSIEPNLAVPAWALGATWYQIFPERFRNGDLANDPTPPEFSPVPWSSDFGSVTIEEIELAWSRERAGSRHASASANRRGGARRATIYSRRYGGDLEGIEQQLDHIQSLGVTAIYLCPIFASSSLHKYDARDFRHIDPTFGPVDTNAADADPWGWTAADLYFLDVFLPAARARGLRVVLDGVWNHTGTDFWAFLDLVSRGVDSPYKNWFRARFDANGSLVGWDGWDAKNGNLPEFQQTPDGDLVPEVSEHIFAVTSRWMDPNGDGDPSDGIDGWRLDVAPEIGNAFWSRWRAHVRSINPNAALYGEIWFDAEPWFNGVAFDAQMNYPFASAVVEWAAGAPRTSSSLLADRLRRTFNHAPQTDLAQMNLLDSHDTARLLTMIERPAATYDDGATSGELGRDSVSARPAEESARRAILALALQVAALGSPMVFAGDELGVFGPDDPDNRKPIQWPDLAAPENGGDSPDLQLLDEYKYWLSLRRHPTWGDTLRYGTIRSLYPKGDDVLAISRELNDLRVTVVVNRGHSEFDASDLIPFPMDDSIDTRVPPLSARCFSGVIGAESRRERATKPP